MFTNGRRTSFSGSSAAGLFSLMVFLVLFTAGSVFGAEAPTSVEGNREFLEGISRNIDTLWVILAGVLVMFMHAGFALLESGFCRAKNACNMITKNIAAFSISAISFWAVGFALMFGSGYELFGASGFFLMADPDVYTGIVSGTRLPLEAKYFFQMVFAATAATIVSGAVAGRTKFSAYLVYSTIITAIIYPIAGHWIWGGGWIADLHNTLGFVGEAPFIDFAGSTVVHSVGGWVALCGALVLGPRIGKYNGHGESNPIPGHNIPLAALGTFILWFGWFGFNAGSHMAVVPEIANVAAVTNLSAAAGMVSAMITTWIVWERPDTSMALNGAIGGLVAITAPCNSVTLVGAALIGVVAGVLIVGSVIFIDTVLNIDDPVGAISAHGTCGIWGTLAAGLFATETGLFYGGGFDQLIVQGIGIAAIGAYCLAVGFPMFYLIQSTIGFRVEREEELRGLDIDEHGMEAYPGFQTFLTE